MAKRPYTHEMYLRTKESRKRATEKWFSKVENKRKRATYQANYSRWRYQNDPQYKMYQRTYQKQYLLEAKRDPIKRAKLIENQKNASKRFRERKYLKSANGDLIKFAEYLNKSPRMKRPQEQRKELNRAKASFKAIIRNLKRKANLVAIYGGCCAMCGENLPELLHLHHINGGGGRERKQVGFHHIISDAIDHPDWSKYQLLCETCHQEAHRWLYFFDHRA